MSEIRPNDRVSIDNLMNWNLYFEGIESSKDMMIPGRVKDWKQMSVAEIDAQIKAGNKFFSGIDGLGTNAHIKINSDEVRKYVFGIETESEDEKLPKQKVLDLEAVKELLSITPKAKFEEKLLEVVVTPAEKKMITQLAKEAGVDNVEAYKANLIEKHSGIEFKE